MRGARVGGGKVERGAAAPSDEPLLIEQCRVPAELFRIVTARTPDAPAPREAHPAQIGVSGDHRVISLLERRHYGQGDLIHLLYHGMTVLPGNRQHSAHVDIGGDRALGSAARHGA
jgi:hypothetical protein